MPIENYPQKSRRSRSNSPRPSNRTRAHLPKGIEPIDVEHDFFSKSAEFRLWLKEEKDKFIDQIDSEKAKSYFSKFARHWNKGKLHSKYYELPSNLRASSTMSSSHAWSFKDVSTLEKDRVKAAREEAFDGPMPASSSSLVQKPLIGPLLPPQASSSSSATTLSEFQYNKELEDDISREDIRRKKAEMKRKRQDERDEERTSRATGKDRLLEKRMERRYDKMNYQQDREDRTAVDLDDRSMFGSDSSFQAAVQARDRAQARHKGNRSNFKQEKQIVMQEKMAVMKSKEDETMSMLKALAASKFGPSA